MKCEKCNTNNVRIDMYVNIICLNCGFITKKSIFTDNIDNTADMYNASQTDIFLPQTSTCIPISKNCINKKLKMLNRWHMIPYEERSFNVILNYIEDICKNNNIDKSIEYDTKIICNQILKRSDTNTVIYRGKNRNNIIAGALFIACIKNKKPYSPNEIASFMNIKKTNVTIGYSIVTKVLSNKKLQICEYNNTNSSLYFIKRFINELSLNIDFNDAEYYYNIIEQLKLSYNHTPLIVALMVLIATCKSKYTDIDIISKIISNVNISIVTLSKITKEITAYLYLINDKDKIDKILYISSIFSEHDLELTLNILKNVRRMQNMLTILSNKIQYIYKLLAMTEPAIL